MMQDLTKINFYVNKMKFILDNLTAIGNKDLFFDNDLVYMINYYEKNFKNDLKNLNEIMANQIPTVAEIVAP